MSQNESTTFLVTDAKNLTLIEATRENSPWCDTWYLTPWYLGAMEESSNPIESSRKLVQISFVSVQICTLQVSQSRIPDQIYRFLSKFENKD